MATTKLKKVRNVLELAELCKSGEVSNLDSWSAFNRIFRVSSATGEMTVPEAFKPKISRWFEAPSDSGPEQSVKRAEFQTVVRIFDRWSCNQTCFNAARSCRPVNNGSNGMSRQESFTEGPVVGCDFCDPYNLTAQDTWGRLENKSVLTASNVAKYDALHTMIVFKEHPPSRISEEKVFDMCDIASQWFEITHKKHPEFIYPILSWNCRSRAGASQHHGHSHMLLGSNFHYGHWERLNQISKLYSAEYPGCNYFDDLIEAHRTVNLAHQVGSAWILIHLAPYCGYEFKIICWDFNDDFKRAMYKAVDALVHVFGSYCFNACLQFPPLEGGKLRQPLSTPECDDVLANHGKAAKKQKVDETRMPFLVHLVDRGDINKGTTSDVCSMRIYGSAIVNEDPFVLAETLKWLE